MICPEPSNADILSGLTMRHVHALFCYGSVGVRYMAERLWEFWGKPRACKPYIDWLLSLSDEELAAAGIKAAFDLPWILLKRYNDWLYIHEAEPVDMWDERRGEWQREVVIGSRSMTSMDEWLKHHGFTGYDGSPGSDDWEEEDDKEVEQLVELEDQMKQHMVQEGLLYCHEVLPSFDDEEPEQQQHFSYYLKNPQHYLTTTTQMVMG